MYFPPGHRYGDASEHAHLIRVKGHRTYVESKSMIYYTYIHIIYIITRVSVRYGEIFHEPKASEISRHISPYLTADECNKCFILIGTPPGSFSH